MILLSLKILVAKAKSNRRNNSSGELETILCREHQGLFGSAFGISVTNPKTRTYSGRSR
jgi:hypothetical protein